MVKNTTLDFNNRINKLRAEGKDLLHRKALLLLILRSYSWTEEFSNELLEKYSYSVRRFCKADIKPRKVVGEAIALIDGLLQCRGYIVFDTPYYSKLIFKNQREYELAFCS